MSIGGAPGDAVRQLCLHAQTRTPAVVLVVALTRGGVLGIAVVVLPVGRDLEGQAGRGRQVDRATHHLALVRAEAGFEEAAGRVARILHDNGNRAAGGVAAEQCALRPAQHLDPLDIEEAEVVGVLAADIDVIDIGADRRIEGCDRFRVADPAQVIGVGRTQAGVVEAHQVRHELGHIQRGVDPARLQRFGIEGRNRDRHVLYAFGAALGGDDDVLKPLVIVCRFLRLGRGGQHGDKRNGAQQCSTGHRRSFPVRSIPAPAYCDGSRIEGFHPARPKLSGHFCFCQVAKCGHVRTTIAGGTES